MADAKKKTKKHGLFDNIRFSQLTFNCKYFKKSFAYRSEYLEENWQKSILISEGFLFLIYFFLCWVGFPPKF